VGTISLIDVIGIETLLVQDSVIDLINQRCTVNTITNIILVPVSTLSVSDSENHNLGFLPIPKGNNCGYLLINCR
jgi:hypothetical protein